MSGWDGPPPTVADVGEFGLIAELRSALPAAAAESPQVPIGIGDDCAVWTPSAGESVVVTTDSLVEGVHFRTDWTDPASLGHKTLAVNLSDLASMGAAPRLAVVTLGLRGDESVADLRAMYAALGALAAGSGTVIAGGDIVRSPTAMTLHVTAIGETVGGRVLTRSGARVGDVVAVSGTIGASAAGLALLELDPDDPRRRAATAGALIDAHLRPEPRLELGSLLLRSGASAAMDLSDGLLGDLPKVLAASHVSARVAPGRLPVAAAVRALFPDRWAELAMRGGEDYELLFTAPPEAFATISAEAGRLGVPVTAIGEIVAAAGEPEVWLVDGNGRVRPADSGAFDHFG